MLRNIFRNLVLDDRIKSNQIDRDSEELLRVHAKIIKDKKIIYNVFQEFYKICDELRSRHIVTSNKKIIELGAGVSFIKDLYPNVTTSDIKNYEGVDIVIDAQEMKFYPNEINCFYGINCFHHFPDPRKFFNELERTLELGGGAILIEPFYGWFSNILYKKVHDEEFYDKTQQKWETGQNKNQFMTGANQALSYLIFIRDRKIFEQEFPNLEIVETKIINNYLRYLISGGVNFKQLLPSFMEKPLKLLEILFKPFNSIFALHYIIVIRKKA